MRVGPGVRRVLTKEWLDLGSASPPEVADDLVQLRWINRNCGGARLLVREFERIQVEDGPPGRPLHVLDVATGSADLPQHLIDWGRRRGFSMRVTAVERNPEVLKFARAEAGAVPELRLIRGDALELPILPSSCDYALCSLFLHQLHAADSLALLRRLLACARRAVLINDLLRHPVHFAAAWVLARALTRNPITRHDAPASVRNAYTTQELRELGRASGAARVELSRHVPFRACMVLRP